MVVSLKGQVMECQSACQAVLFLLAGGAAPNALQVQMGKRQNGRSCIMLLALCLQVQAVVVTPTAPDEIIWQIAEPSIHSLNSPRERRRFVDHFLGNAGKLSAELAQHRMPDGAN